MSEREDDYQYFGLYPRKDRIELETDPKIISVTRFKKEYSRLLAQYPFKPSYIGEKNTYTDHVIKNETDYRLFLREKVYSDLCLELSADTAAAMKIAEKAEKEKKSAKLQEESAKRIQSIAEKSADEAKQNYQRVLESRMQVHKRYIISILVLAVISTILLFMVISNKKTQSANSYDQGHDVGYSEGYDAGYSSGYRDGKKFATENARTYQWAPGGSGSSSAGSTRATPISDDYIGNTSSKKFHLPTCSYLPDRQNQTTFSSREEAIAAGYTPCGHCNP